MTSSAPLFARLAVRLPRLGLFAAAVLLGACASAPAVTPTATRALTGPTLEPSPNPFAAGPPTEAQPYTLDEGQFDPTVAAAPAQGALPPIAASPGGSSGGGQSVQFPALDGTPLEADLYAQGEARVPGLLLVSQSRTDWGLLPVQLQAAGYTVLVLGLRSGAPSQDVVAGLDALGEVGTVDPARVGIIGAGAGADPALLACAQLALCDGAALLSPQNRSTLLNVLPDYGARPLLVAVSSSDAAALETARDLVAFAGDAAQLAQYENAGSGAQIALNRPDFVDTLLAWLAALLPDVG